MKILAIISLILIGLGAYALLNFTSKADDHAKIMCDSKEEK
jgi:predicted transporter